MKLSLHSALVKPIGGTDSYSPVYKSVRVIASYSTILKQRTIVFLKKHALFLIRFFQ
ncbi:MULTISPECIES: hypothetical protein [Leptospira]|uniref:Uncharacterized protein n=4 Tax=Leptospira borgpetersenii TaxID=174 RepID=M3HJP5_LEPBO|nr:MULTISPECIES: hypothetical protein [Leptospira]EMF97884.1 hypothetical protein LEP1GSC123_4216 [Leptospira borgpetersenii str. 200701203]EMN11377.1 hypothetical protein LEP1GSC055_2635 [Leptospira borgpetersenii str. Brem 307]EKP14150.1 hypothetical protein LEP1GSC128_2909 [Leptospira borgpetersenii str. 200801926]EKQ90701.1 hypothetical protein LEP1GSC101_0608 [Leptospira borgpetersenii str. UI 09149]EMK13112.1 hypothetical protein LEP1GSC066_3426 [Leptospira sp. serovar Kenya str. Sh9]